MNEIDLNQPPPNHKYSIAVEREETDLEQKVRLFKDVMLFLLCIAFVTAMAWICVSTLQDPVSSEDSKRWAMSVLSAAAGGILGFLVKK